MDGSAIVSGAAKAASYNMLLQLGLRLTTFVLNAVILRYVSKDILGIVNVRLTLLYSTTLFLTKEAFDRACLSKSGTCDWKQVINLLWCTFPLAILCSGCLGMVWLYVLENPSTVTSVPLENLSIMTSVPGYTVGVFCFALSTIIEVLAEPLFVVGQAFLFVRLKVVLLGLSQGIKCIITMVLVLWQPQWGIVNFSIAQVISSVTYAALYHGYFVHYIASNKKEDDFPLKTVADMYPRILSDKPFIDIHLASLTWSFFKQSFLKQILTEGEKFVMTFFDVLSFGDQGVYDVVANLGSLAARFIFLPIEENSYLLFSKLLNRGEPAAKQSQESLRLSVRVLGVVLKIVTIIGAIILIFGFSNSYLALHIYGGDVLSSGAGPILLRWHCLYVLIIAVNGTSEAFVFAAMSKDDVDRYNKKMVVFSALFLLSSWLLTRLVGSVGFILANCFNMLARIAHSVYFIQGYLSGTGYSPLHEILPSVPVIGSLLLSLVVTSLSEHMLCRGQSVVNKLIHIVITGVCLLAVLLIVFLTEKNLIALVKEQMAKVRGPRQKISEKER
ncbi:hypothetical protein BsWGS_03101 [Bradybaena similaris]